MSKYITRVDPGLSLFQYNVLLIQLSFNYSDISLWGMESVYRNDELVGYLRRAEHGYTFKSSIGQA